MLDDDARNSPAGAAAVSPDSSACGARPAGPTPPDWADRIGRARYQVVMEYRKAREAAPYGGKCSAGREWIELYNTGTLLPFAYRVIGKTTVKSVRRWEKRLLDSGMDYYAVCPRYGDWYGGVRPRKVTRAEAGALVRAYCNPHRPKIQTAITWAKLLLARERIPVISSDSTMRRWLHDFMAEYNDVVVLAREGEKAAKDQCEPYITRDPRLLEVGDVLVADGKRLNFEVIHPFTGRPHRPALIWFMDWASRKAVGWEIMPTEDTVAISSALYRSILTLGKTPKAVYVDNGKAFKAKVFTGEHDLEMLAGTYARLGIRTHFARPYNARAKVVERYFLTFQEEFERLMPSYIGSSIEERPARLKRNERLHRAAHVNRVPTLAEAMRAVAAYVSYADGKPHPDFKEVTVGDIFEAGRGEGVDLEEVRWQFLWRRKAKPRRCRVRLSGVDYESDALYGLKQHVMVLWAWWDMSRVYLYDMRGNPLGEALPTRAIYPLIGILSGPEREVHQAALKHELGRQQQLRRWTRRLARGTGDASLLDKSWMRPERIAIPANPERVEAEEQEKALLVAEVSGGAEVVERPEREPEFPRPEYFAGQVERYFWCVEARHKHGMALSEDDQAHVESFEADEVNRIHVERARALKGLWARWNKEEVE